MRAISLQLAVNVCQWQSFVLESCATHGVVAEERRVKNISGMQMVLAQLGGAQGFKATSPSQPQYMQIQVVFSFGYRCAQQNLQGQHRQQLQGHHRQQQSPSTSTRSSTTISSAEHPAAGLSLVCAWAKSQ